MVYGEHEHGCFTKCTKPELNNPSQRGTYITAKESKVPHVEKGRKDMDESDDRSELRELNPWYRLGISESR